MGKRSLGASKPSAVGRLGSANLVSALNMLYQKMLINSSTATSEDSMILFNHALQDLQDRKLIRKKPEKVRELFKVVE